MTRVIVALLCLAPLSALGQEPAKPAAAPAAAPAAEAQPKTEAAPSKAEAQPKVEAQAPSAYEVVDAKLGTGVTDREPEGVAESFKVDAGRIYCWTKVKAPEGGGVVTHAWYKGDEKQSEVKLNLKFASVRTWSYKTLTAESAGDWHVDVLAPDGTVLKTVAFKVE